MVRAKNDNKDIGQRNVSGFITIPLINYGLHAVNAVAVEENNTLNSQEKRQGTNIRTTQAIPLVLVNSIMPYIYLVFHRHALLLSGASACVQLNQFEEAVTCCDKGLAVSFTTVEELLYEQLLYEVETIFALRVPEEGVREF